MGGPISRWVIRNFSVFPFPLHCTVSFPKPPEYIQQTYFNSLTLLNLTTPLPTPGWRNQIPTLLSLSYRIVCPDLIGFGRTAAPPVSPPYDTNTNIQYYSFKRAASDINELARQLDCKTIILGGHDWVRTSNALAPFHDVSILCTATPCLFVSSHEH